MTEKIYRNSIITLLPHHIASFVGKKIYQYINVFFLLINPRFINFHGRNISEIYIFFLEIYQFSGKLERLNKVIWLCFLKFFFIMLDVLSLWVENVVLQIVMGTTIPWLMWEYLGYKK